MDHMDGEISRCSLIHFISVISSIYGVFTADFVILLCQFNLCLIFSHIMIKVFSEDFISILVTFHCTAGAGSKNICIQINKVLFLLLESALEVLCSPKSNMVYVEVSLLIRLYYGMNMLLIKSICLLD